MGFLPSSSDSFNLFKPGSDIGLIYDRPALPSISLRISSNQLLVAVEFGWGDLVKHDGPSPKHHVAFPPCFKLRRSIQLNGDKFPRG